MNNQEEIDEILAISARLNCIEEKMAERHEFESKVKYLFSNDVEQIFKILVKDENYANNPFLLFDIPSGSKCRDLIKIIFLKEDYSLYAHVGITKKQFLDCNFGFPTLFMINKKANDYFNRDEHEVFSWREKHEFFDEWLKEHKDWQVLNVAIEMLEEI